MKPANIKLTPDGKVKVLDFGLAKAFVEHAPDADSSTSPTITRDATRVGVILGTAAYMSPEQAKGKHVDKRADIGAFGAVLYEMLVGRRAFEGEDLSDTLAAVLRAEPDFGALPAGAPSALRLTLKLCLQKDMKRRLSDVRDVRLAMEGVFVSIEAVPQQAGWRHWYSGRGGLGFRHTDGHRRVGRHALRIAAASSHAAFTNVAAWHPPRKSFDALVRRQTDCVHREQSALPSAHESGERGAGSGQRGCSRT